MTWLRNLSIRAKLSLVIGALSAVAISLACAAFVTLSYVQRRQALVAQLSSITDIVGYQSAAALEFDDRDDATRILASLHSQQCIAAARIYHADTRALAEYARDPDEAPAPRLAPPDGIEFEAERVTLTAPILVDGERIGTLWVASKLTELDRALRWGLCVSACILAACLAIVVALATPLGRLIAGPIVELSRIARQVSEHHDYSVRAHKRGEDELGTLVDSFNQMLERIERDADLELQRRHLEAEARRRKALIEELRFEKERAEAAAEAKTRFLANMSHEIRTPMTAVLGFTELLLDTGDLKRAPVERIELLNSIRRNGQHLMTVINDILDFSKIESGKLLAERVRFAPLQIIEDVRSLLRIRADEKGLELSTDYREPLPRLMIGDPTRVRQILINLVGNAIKFTERGGVTLRVESAGADRLRISVIDTGIGVSNEQRAQLFRPFEQGDSSTTREYGGTGLGLSISSQLATLMGGTLTVEGKPGHGSTFTLELPTPDLESFREPPSHEIEAPVPKGPSPDVWTSLACRILVAEDAPDNQRLIEHVLTHAGAEVLLAPNGQIAMELALEAERRGQPFEIILMDMQMPVLDGYEATRRLRQQGYTRPIVALTAHAMSEERDRCLAAGCDEFATKPLDRPQLLDTIRQQLDLARDENV